MRPVAAGSEATRTTEPAGEEPLLRRAVAVFLSRFPTVSETFILREVDELERQGRPVRLVPLIRDDPPVTHPAARPWMDRALFTPWLSPEIVRANLRALAAGPRRYLGLLARLVAGTIREPGILARTLALFPKSVYLAGRLEAEGIRHVHAQFATHPTTMALIVGTLSEIDFSFTAHAHDIFVSHALLGEKLREAAFVRVISGFNRRYLLQRHPEVDEETIRVVHVGIPAGRYADAASGRGRDDGPPTILSVASLRPYKGVRVLVEACRHLRDAGLDFRCEIVGDGPLRREVEERIARHGLDDVVQLRGAVSEDRIPGLLAGASVFAHPSVVQDDGQMDGIPVAIMEAMAAGLPVVTSRLSGIPELVAHGETGFAVEPGSAVDVAEGLATLLEDPDRARALGRAGRRRVEERFRLDGCVAELDRLLDAHAGTAPPEVVDAVRRAGPASLLRGRVGLRRIHRSRDSWVAELVVSRSGGGEEREGLPPEVVLKVHRSRPGASAPATRRARREFRALEALEGIGAPRPLHLAADAGALLMTPCRGPSLVTRIRRLRLAPDPAFRELLPDLRAAGRWLRRFQERTRSPGSSDAALDDVVTRALDDARAWPGAGDEDREAFRRRIAGLRGAASSGRALVGRHGDFWPGNVHVRRGSAEVIDFEGVGRGHPSEDAGNFLVQLRLSLVHPGLGARRRRLARAFLEGYGLRPGADLPPGLEICRLAAAARIRRTDAGGSGPGGVGGALRRWALLGVLRGESA